MSGIAYVDGSSGDDALIGSRFADDLRGGAGIDGFIGGAGDDRLTGGSGNDLFGFVKGHGHDTITDFVAGSSVADRIQLDDQEFANFAAVKAASHQVGNDVVISTDSFDSITAEQRRPRHPASERFRIRVIATDSKPGARRRTRHQCLCT
jgi:Ca2+-binding RTX toxin-like protein